MNILLYFDIFNLIEKNNYCSMSILNDHLYGWLIKPLLSTNHEISVKTIMPEVTYSRNLKYKKLNKLNPSPIFYDEIKEIFGETASLDELLSKTYGDNFSENEIEGLKKLFLDKLGDYKPDIIIAYPVGETIIKKIFPDSLVLTAENSIFSRPPFPRTIQYDPMNLFNSFFNKYKEEINNFPITEEQNKAVENLKTKILELVDENNNMKEIIQNYKKKFKYLLLAPLTSLTNVFKSETVFSDDFDYLSYIMERIPKNIGVIVTQHDFENGLLNDKLYEYFSSKYENLIFIKSINNLVYGSSSLTFYNDVDAIIVTMTQTGTNSLFWDKKIISLAKTYNNWMCDKNDLENIEEFLSEPKRNKNNLIYWYLTHYPLYYKRITDGEWLYNYFSKKLEKFKRDGLTFNYFEQIEDIDELSKYIISHIEDNYRNPHKKREFWEKVFSVYNEADSKFLSILGVKIRIR